MRTGISDASWPQPVALARSVGRLTKSRSRRSMGLPRPPAAPSPCRRPVAGIPCLQPRQQAPRSGTVCKSALLHPLRSRTTCENAGLHSGKRVIADKDEVPGSSPGRPTNHSPSSRPPRPIIDAAPSGHVARFVPLACHYHGQLHPLHEPMPPGPAHPGRPRWQRPARP
jgi:hypothetical protein